ncbi:hypothetical protein FQZ97_692080 [compost metagenome]
MRAHVFARQRQIAQDGGEQVVEIVRHAPGQGTDGLHLLRLAQLRFERALLGFGLLELGDVGVGTDHAQRQPVAVARNHDPARQHPLPAAVLATDAVLVAVHR